MREILGKRRTNRTVLRDAALCCTRQWGWPVVPGVGTGARGRCACGRRDCPVPGAHPGDPELLAASTDARMVRWWWTRRPQAPIILATGAPGAPCALSLPAAAGTGALAELERRGVRPGPVVATATRVLLLVEPYDHAELGELLFAQDRVPSSLRFHGSGGYLPLPPAPGGLGAARWVREPEPERGRVALPRAADLVDVLVAAGELVPDTGSRLAY